jgi:hypothetical protein
MSGLTMTTVFTWEAFSQSALGVKLADDLIQCSKDYTLLFYRDTGYHHPLPLIQKIKYE